MEELQNLADPDQLTAEISHLNDDINEFQKELIAREVELLNGLEVGGASLVYFTDPHVKCSSHGMSSFILTDSVRLDLIKKHFQKFSNQNICVR